MPPAFDDEVPGQLPDYADVVGHGQAKRALLIAAAGGHNLLMTGPPGSGKTMLARRLPGILPPLSAEERLQTALVHSVAGLDPTEALNGIRPFRAPHHTCSIAGLVGGGSPPRPGEASLAHNGVLFLDEMPEFGPACLQALRQPMEDGVLSLVRAEGRVVYPSSFVMVAAMNPCPCGYMGDPEKTCSCPEDVVRRYQGRLGGPLMDRLDIGVAVSRIDPSRLMDGTVGKKRSSEMAAEVAEARRRAAAEGRRNSALRGRDLLAACGMNGKARAFLEHYARAKSLSGRAVTRVLRVARTIADLDSAERVRSRHVEEATSYRPWEET